MITDNLFHLFLEPLNRTGCRYMVTGAVAGVIYGDPRLTHDLDLVIELEQADIEEFRRHFPPAEFYCPPPEVIRIETKRAMRGHFNLIHHGTGFKADIYLMGTEELHAWGMAGRRCYSMGDESIWVAPPEYVILRKLQYYREGGSDKHLKDIAGILATSSDDIDFKALEEKVHSFHLEANWKQAKDTIR